MGVGWFDREAVKDLGAEACRPLGSSRTVITLALLSKPSILLKSPPRSRLKLDSIVGGVTVVEVDDVVARALPAAIACSGLGTGGMKSSSEGGTGGKFFFCPPKEKVRPAAFRNEPDDADLGIDGGREGSLVGFLLVFLPSSCPVKSADDGAVETLLCRDESSVEAVFVVLEDPLPLFTVSKASCSSRRTTSCPIIVIPMSNGKTSCTQWN